MLQFPHLVALRPTDAEAHVYALQVRLKHQTEADVPALAALIERAAELIAGDCQQYLAGCVERVGAMLASAAPSPARKHCPHVALECLCVTP